MTLGMLTIQLDVPVPSVDSPPASQEPLEPWQMDQPLSTACSSTMAPGRRIHGVTRATESTWSHCWALGLWSVADRCLSSRLGGDLVFRLVVGTGCRWLLASFLCQWGCREPKIEAPPQSHSRQVTKKRRLGRRDGQHWFRLRSKCLFLL